jgi:hypothetical protein
MISYSAELYKEIFCTDATDSSKFVEATMN